MGKNPLRVATDEIGDDHILTAEGKDALFEFVDMRIDEWFAENLTKYEES